MPRPGIKALFAVLNLNRMRERRPDWDIVIIVCSTLVTIGLVALYAYGKVSSRW
jgi:hypothetical protein